MIINIANTIQYSVGTTRFEYSNIFFLPLSRLFSHENVISKLLKLLVRTPLDSIPVNFRNQDFQFQGFTNTVRLNVGDRTTEYKQYSPRLHSSENKNFSFEQRDETRNCLFFA